MSEKEIELILFGMLIGLSLVAGAMLVGYKWSSGRRKK